MSRKFDFMRITEALKNYHHHITSRSLAVRGDALDILKHFPDQSVSMILTDPPYHSTQKENIAGDTIFENDEEFLKWIDSFVTQWKRILKPNGSLYCFASSIMASRVENSISEDFNILSHIVWTKPNEPGFDGWKQKMKKSSLRQWYGYSERIIFAEPSIEGNLYKVHFAQVIREARVKSNLSQKDLTGLIGAYGKVNHGGAVSNWEAGRNVPNEEQYEELRNEILKIGKVKRMPEYRDLVRPFFIDKEKQYTDIWMYPNVRPYNGKHPAEKPVSLLENIIQASTYPNDIVLDCFAGSGTTAIAALKNDRQSISIEIENKWYQRIKSIIQFIEENNYKIFPDNYKTTTMNIDNYQMSFL